MYNISSFTPYDLSTSYAELSRVFPDINDLSKIVDIMKVDPDLKEAFVNYFVLMQERRRNTEEVAIIRDQYRMLIAKAMKNLN